MFSAVHAACSMHNVQCSMFNFQMQCLSATPNLMLTSQIIWFTMFHWNNLVNFVSNINDHFDCLCDRGSYQYYSSCTVVVLVAINSRINCNAMQCNAMQEQEVIQFIESLLHMIQLQTNSFQLNIEQCNWTEQSYWKENIKSLWSAKFVLLMTLLLLLPLWLLVVGCLVDSYSFFNFDSSSSYGLAFLNFDSLLFLMFNVMVAML